MGLSEFLPKDRTPEEQADIDRRTVKRFKQSLADAMAHARQQPSFLLMEALDEAIGDDSELDPQKLRKVFAAAIQANHRPTMRYVQTVLNEHPELASAIGLDSMESPESPGGISLLDVALLLTDGNIVDAKAKRREWHNSRNPKLPKMIGIDSEDGRSGLYSPSSILPLIGKIEFLSAAKLSTISTRLKHRIRPCKSR